MHDPIAKTGAWVKQMLTGHLNYFAVSGNHPSLWWFFNKVSGSGSHRSSDAAKRHASAGRGSSSSSPASFRQSELYTRCLSPLRRQNPRQEPGALAAHAGICAGGEEKSSSLPRPFQLFSRSPPRCISVGCDLAPNDVDVTAQIIQLVGKG
jgi:hypothetical protein